MDKLKTANPALVNGLDRIQNLIPTKPTDIKKPEGKDTGSLTSFKETLGEALKTDVAAPKVHATKAEKPQLKFSNHAVERMQSRGISYSPEEMTRLTEAVQKA